MDVLLSRIGYTGEFGYVFFVQSDQIASLVERIREAAPEAVLCGPAVQDLLRLEVRAFNLARDIVSDETALEAGLHWMIDFRKEHFNGRAAVMAEKARGLRYRLVAFVLNGDQAIDRGAAVRDDGRQVGHVAHSAWSPTLRQIIGLAYLDDAYAWVGIDLAVDTARGPGPVRTVSAPFLVTESTLSAAG
jgi:aminomethyltransferase